MILRILITPQAIQDLDELFNYITENNIDAANRFFDAARQTMASLAKTPGVGSLYLSNNPRLLGLRRWGVRNYEKYLIFYMASEDLLTVVRIIHGSRDIPSIFELPESE